MSTRELIRAILNGDAQHIEEAFNQVITEKLNEQLKETRMEYSRKMFRADATMDEQGFGPGQCPFGGPMRKRARLRLRAGQMEEDFDFTDAELEEELNEVLSKSASAGEWISDFVKSDDPRFKGKSKKKRIQQALAAYYSKQREK